MTPFLEVKILTTEKSQSNQNLTISPTFNIQKLTSRPNRSNIDYKHNYSNAKRGQSNPTKIQTLPTNNNTETHGVIAAWSYTMPQVNVAVDAVFKPYYAVDVEPCWDPARKKVDNEYRSIDFPFEHVEGLDDTGPFQSWSSYQTAKDKGVELLNDRVIEEFARAWNEDGTQSKTVVFPVHLRIGKVESLDS
ncbi:hypothetical protein DCAR_0831991 [Daucus carota subsp. sativus]|uniref:Uncharacterized protein n=1 Tax=Daucus carota subsp. sativus TaxID=79200 RepID=A0AAF1BCX5_DAUCS|nr:hypothetical protein DCAR_0831991 [Daucus carota subsp. sativus]